MTVILWNQMIKQDEAVALSVYACQYHLVQQGIWDWVFWCPNSLRQGITGTYFTHNVILIWVWGEGYFPTTE